MSAEQPWPGCHGVRLRSETDLGLGHHVGLPLATVDVGVASVPSHLGDVAEPVWSVAWPAPATGPPEADGASGAMRVQRGGDGAMTLEVAGGRRLHVVPEQGSLTVTPPFDGIQAQLVASFGLPMVVEALPSVLVIHAAAVAAPDGTTAVLIVGPGGAGKSSALIGLMGAGWAPLSEDVCVIDLADSAPRVWPGPPWVRVDHGQPGPPGTEPLFRTSEKTAWALGSRQPHRALPVGFVVSLEAPGGEEPYLSALSASEAIGALAGHAVWLGDQDQKPRHLFGPLAAVAARLPVMRVRLPYDRNWVDQLAALLAPVAEGSSLGGVVGLGPGSGR